MRRLISLGGLALLALLLPLWFADLDPQKLVSWRELWGLIVAAIGWLALVDVVYWSLDHH